MRTYWIIALALTIAAWGASAWLYPSLPERIPTHWNLGGEVDGWGDKTWAAFLTPALMIAILLLFVFLPALSPKHFEVDRSRSTYLYIMVLFMALLAYFHGVIMYATWQEVGPGVAPIDLGRALLGGIFLFLAFVVGVIRKLQKNFYIGIRVPWTLASDRVWKDTHRLAGWIMVGVGVVGLALIALGGSPIWAFGVLIASMAIPVVYSFVHYKALERSGALGD
jgi:uncharacterized membrane protein